MAERKISSLQEQLSPNGTEEFPYADNGDNGKIKLDTMVEYVKDNLPEYATPEDLENKADKTGVYPAMRVGYANDLYTADNPVDIDTWNFRTTAGQTSISTGQATVNAIMGHIEITGRVASSISTSATAGWTVSYNKTKFETQITTTGVYTFEYDNGDWELDNNPVDIADYGLNVVIPSGAITGQVVVTYTAMNRGTINIATPATLVGTGVNQLDLATFTPIQGEIQAGEIVAGNNYIYYVKAAGGVTNGYMAYDPDGSINSVGYITTEPQIGDTVDQTGATVTANLGSMPFDHDGYFVVECTTQPTTLSIHPKWSGQEDSNTDAYAISTLQIPTKDANNVDLPTATYGIPALGGVYDEINFANYKYIKRIGYLENTPANLHTVEAYGTTYDYDSNIILYVLKSEDIVEYNLPGSTIKSYTANDYGTEYYTGTTIPLTTTITYGSNLTDKLRSDVIVKAPGSTVNKLWVGTQNALNGIAVRDPNTFYAVKEPSQQPQQ